MGRHTYATRLGMVTAGDLQDAVQPYDCPEKLSARKAPIPSIKDHGSTGERDYLPPSCLNIFTGPRAVLGFFRVAQILTKSDMKTMVYPGFAFSAVAALSDSMVERAASPSPADLTCRLSGTFLFLWLLILIFDLSNQRLPQSVLEDRINKLWRAIPSGQLTPARADLWLYTAVPLTILVTTLYLGGAIECVIFLGLTYVYNDRGGGDASWFLRQLLNAGGVTSFVAGGTQVATRFNTTLALPLWPLDGWQNGVDSLATRFTGQGVWWLLVVGAVVFSTIQVQDLGDEEGDAERGRRTMPLCLGDRVTRWSTAVAVGVWSIYCPFFWSVGWVGFVGLMFVGQRIAWRLVFLRSREESRRTFEWWCLWMGCLYLLPLLR